MKPTTVIPSALLFFSFSDVIADTGMPDKNMQEKVLCGSVIYVTSKKPLKDVNIRAVLNANEEKIILTGKNGTYQFLMLKPGIYKLIFEKEGYKVTKESVLVSGNRVLQINIA